MVRFFQNIKAFSEEKDGVKTVGWEWDEYHLEMNSYGGLAEDVAANLAQLLAQAKAIEDEKNIIPDLQSSQSQMRSDIEYRGGCIRAAQDYRIIFCPSQS